MKTRYYMIGAALCSTMGLGLTSCNNDSFLDVDQYEIIANDAMFENDDNAKKGLNGVYDMLFPNGTQVNGKNIYDGDWGFKPNLFTLVQQSFLMVGAMYMQVSLVPMTISQVWRQQIR